MKIRNVSHVGASVAALFLAACGGGGGSSNDGGSGGQRPVDTTPPTLTITPASTTVEAGGTLALTITASDNLDSTVQWSVSCTQGSVADATFTAPQVTTSTTVTCTVSATDAAGNRGSATASITVVPAAALELPESETTLQGGQFGVLFASNLTLDQDTYEGELDGEAITLVRQGSDTLLFVVPTYFSAGEKTLSVKIGERTFTHAVNVTAAPVIDDPLAVVRDVFEDAKTSLQQVLVDEDATLSAEHKATLQGLLDDLDDGVSALSTMSAADLQALAVVLTSNGFTETSALAMSRMLKVNVTECNDAARAFLRAHIKTVAKIGLFALTGYALAAPEVAVSKAVAAGLIAYLYFSTKELNANVVNVVDKCIVELGAQLIAEIGNANGSQKAGGLAIAYAADTRYGFTNDVPRSFQIERTMRLHDSVLGSVQQAFNRLISALNNLPILPSPARELLENMKVEKTEFVPASEVSLSGITVENITGTATASGDTLTLRFKAVDAEEENIDFSFKLTRADEEPIVVLAQLTLDLPEAEGGSITVIQGRPKQGLLQVRGADSLELVTTPSRGAVVLQPNGEFTYTPVGFTFGEDEFVYRARNAHGYSEPATVTVSIVREFEGAWRIVADETIHYESQPGLCPSSGTTTYTIYVTKVSDTHYQASFGGYTMNLTMPSADDFNGPEGRLDISYPDGEDNLGTTTESLFIQISSSNTLSGSNDWLYSGPEATSCHGTVNYEGTRP